MNKVLKAAWLSVGVLGVSRLSFSEEVSTAPKRVKIPHNHASMMGGNVLMLGDNHVEIKPGNTPNTLELFTSDRVRDPVDASLFNIEVTLIDGEKKTPLKFEQAKDVKSKVFIELPASHSADASLEIRASKITPIKGEVSSTSPQTISLGEVLKSSRHHQDPHAGHHM